MESKTFKGIALVLIVTLISPNAVRAAEVPIEPTIAPLSCGQPAPWPGVLLNPAAVGSIKFDYDHEKEKIDAIVQKAVADVNAQKNGEIDILKASLKSDLTQKEAALEEKQGHITLLETENKKLRDEVANAPSRGTWFGLGFAGGIAFTVLTAFAIGQVVK
jgi:hypothetical protein